MFEVNNRNTRTRSEICSKLTIKTPDNNFQPHNMPMPKALLQYTKQAHFRYKKALEEKQKQKNKKSVGAIEIEIEIAGLNARKCSA